MDQSGRFYTLRKTPVVSALGTNADTTLYLSGLWGRIEPLSAAEYPEGERVTTVRYFKVALPFGTDISAADTLGMQQGSTILDASQLPASGDLLFSVSGVKSPGSSLPTCVICYVSLEK